jgi:Na+/H+ antiporter NhaC
LIVKLGSLPMKSNRVWELIGHVYNNVYAALWATLLAFVIYLGIFVIPMMPSIQEHQRVRAQEIADENALYCKKLNMKVGTQAFNECLLVLGDFRLKVEQRISSENDDF